MFRKFTYQGFAICMYINPEKARLQLPRINLPCEIIDKVNQVCKMQTKVLLQLFPQNNQERYKWNKLTPC